MSLKYEIIKLHNRLAYCRHGEFHRVGGPADIWCREEGDTYVWSGNIAEYVYYYLYDTSYLKEDYESKVRNY